MSKNKAQVSDEIQKLKFPDSIRTRPGMYTDDIDTGNVLFRELVDNTVDLILKNQISLDINSGININGYHYVMDNGIGLPTYSDPDYEDQPITIDLLSNTHVGSNFSRTTYSIGMNGVGSKLTNALSDHFIVFVNFYKQIENDATRNFPSILMDGYDKNHDTLVVEFKKGILQTYYTEVMSLELLNANLPEEVSSKIHGDLFENYGTILAFKPDTTIIAKNKVEYHAYPFKLMKGLFNKDALYSSLDINFKLNGQEIEAYDFNELYDPEDLMGKRNFSYSFDIETKEKFPIKFLGNFGYHNSAMDFDSIGSVNLLRTHNGKHITIFQRALGKALSKLNPLVKIPDGKYGLRSFTLSFSVEPFFEGQTKNKLGNFKDKGYNENDCIDKLSQYLYDEVVQSDLEFFTGLCNKIVEYKKSLDRLSKKDFILSHIKYASKDPTASLGMGARVHDCTSSKLEERELYLTEGKSAGGNLLPVRDVTKHAILALRGVPMNAANRSIEDIVQNNEFKSLINVVGTGITPLIRMDKRRYGKIIIAADADPAGKFICSLLLGFFAKYLSPWIDEGLVYVLESPLYRQGDKFYYDDKELDKKKPFVRFKGLGEMNPSEVKEHLIVNRRLIKVTTEGLDEALKLIINANNERKDLSRELGILVSNEEFIDAVGETENYILQSIEDSSNGDDDNYDEDL